MTPQSIANLSLGILVGTGIAYGQGAAPTAVTATHAAMPLATAVGDLPPNPKSGERYARIITAAKYQD